MPTPKNAPYKNLQRYCEARVAAGRRRYSWVSKTWTLGLNNMIHWDLGRTAERKRAPSVWPHDKVKTKPLKGVWGCRRDRDRQAVAS